MMFWKTDPKHRLGIGTAVPAGRTNGCPPELPIKCCTPAWAGIVELRGVQLHFEKSADEHAEEDEQPGLPRS